MTYIVAVSGFKNSGKTTLCRKLLKELSLYEISTGYIKHTSENALKSSLHSDTGSVTALGFSTVLWGDDGVTFEEKSEKSKMNPAYIASKYFPDKELLILEGGKNLTLPKIWVCSESGELPDYSGIFMTYDRYGNTDQKYSFGPGEEDKIAKKLYELAKESSYSSSKVYIGNKSLPMKGFVGDFVSSGIIGMLSSLKGAGKLENSIRVYIDTKKINKNS